MLKRTIYDSAFATLLRVPFVDELLVQPGLAGFFGEVFITLNGIRLAELNRKLARVYWGKYSPYFEPEISKNAWSSFFMCSDFDFRVKRRALGLTLPYRPGSRAFLPYAGLSVRQSLGRALQEWCKPRPEIVAAVDAFACQAEFDSRQMLGVHIRRTDVVAGAEGRRTVGLEDFTHAIDDWLSCTPNGGIFLASDDQNVIEYFTTHYPGRVASQDCLRSQDGNSIHGHYDTGVAGSPYNKGREVLIDALLLARCAHLVRTHSRVTAFSLCWNPSLGYRDLEREVIGINRTPWLQR